MLDKTLGSGLSNQKKQSKGTSAEALAEQFYAVIPPVMQALRYEMRKTKGDLTIPQFRVLARIHKGTRHTRDLAEWIGVSLPAISRMVSILEDRELVSRDRQRGDRRYVHLSLTEKGLNYFQDCRSRAKKSLAKRFTDSALLQKEKLINALEILGAALAQPEENQ